MFFFFICFSPYCLLFQSVKLGGLRTKMEQQCSFLGDVRPPSRLDRFPTKEKTSDDLPRSVHGITAMGEPGSMKCDDGSGNGFHFGSG